jgi:putative ABC transport system permease protein
VRESLEGMSGIDPLVVLACALVLGLAMALAGYLPARRVARISPVEVLREE